MGGIAVMAFTALASPVLRLGNESAALILYTPVTAHPQVCVEAQGASGRVALAVTRQGSHRPGRACINASGSSADRFALPKGPHDYPSELRGQAAKPRCAPPVSFARVCRPTLRFPPQGPPGRVPRLPRYYQSATTSCRRSRRASLPSLGGTSAFTRPVRSPADECAAEARSW